MDGQIVGFSATSLMFRQLHAKEKANRVGGGVKPPTSHTTVRTVRYTAVRVGINEQSGIVWLSF